MGVGVGVSVRIVGVVWLLMGVDGVGALGAFLGEDVEEGTFVVGVGVCVVRRKGHMRLWGIAGGRIVVGRSHLIGRRGREEEWEGRRC